MSQLHDPSNRRSFLGQLALGAATLSVPALASGMRLPTELMAPAPSGDDKGLEAWLGNIKGKHKQVFDSMSHNNGIPLAWVRVFLMTNKAVGAAESDVTAVLILRHDSIPLAMESPLWAKYKFGEVFKLTDGATKAPAVANAFWKPAPNSLPVPGMGLNELLDSGVMVGVCDMALKVYSSIVAAGMKLNADEVKKEWVGGIFPGIQLVPSGVLAINRAQEHGCTYCWAG
jgi:intracellular sulfur oxidation DsrE/DsrF family protein